MFRSGVLVLCLIKFMCYVSISCSESVKVVEKGDTVTINCSGNENLLWLRNNETIGSQKIYTFVENTLSFTADKATVGRYDCLSNGATDSTYDIQIRPIPDPENKAEKNAIYGETFVYDCKGFGHPMPVVTWMKDGEELNTTNPRIILKDSGELKNGSLRINQVVYEDSGEYSCIAVNDIGNFTIKVKVNVKDQFAALWPFFGICLEVVILCTIIFIYEKRRSKRAHDEQQKDEGNQLTSNNDQAGEVRQRKV